MFPAFPSDVPPASVKEIPTILNTGNACFVRFRFEACFTRGIVESFHAYWQCPARFA
jgi:hypothetical protein